MKTTIKRLKTAETYIERATEVLDKLMDEYWGEDWGMVGTLTRYKKELSEILSCDHGKCGLSPFIRRLSKEVK